MAIRSRRVVDTHPISKTPALLSDMLRPTVLIPLGMVLAALVCGFWWREGASLGNSFWPNIR
jgi:hypothetical protein